MCLRSEPLLIRNGMFHSDLRIEFPFVPFHLFSTSHPHTNKKGQKEQLNPHPPFSNSPAHHHHVRKAIKSYTPDHHWPGDRPGGGICTAGRLLHRAGRGCWWRCCWRDWPSAGGGGSPTQGPPSTYRTRFLWPSLLLLRRRRLLCRRTRLRPLLLLKGEEKFGD